MAPPGDRERDLRLYILLAVSLLAARVLAGRLLLPYDDAYITFTYSRNLIAGNGFVYYPGDGVLGTTAPLFGLLASLFYLLRLPMPESAVVANAVFDVGALALTVAAAAPARRRVVALIFTCIFAVSPMLARVSVGAMETSLYLAASLSALFLFERGRRGPAFVIASLCYFLRPEALLLLGVLAVEQIRRGPARETLRHAVTAIISLIAPLALMFAVYGQFLPQSVVAKSGTGATLTTVIKQFLGPDPLQLALLLPALWGAVIAFRERLEFERRVIMWAALYLLAYGVARPHVWSWYGVPVYYTVALLAAYGLADLVSRLRMAPLVSRVGPVLAFIPVLVWTAAVLRLGPTPERRVVRDRIATWCTETIRDPETTIAASDIGVVGYYAGSRIIDLNGLVWPQLREYGSWSKTIRAVRPDYLFLNASPSTVEMMRDPEIGPAYEPVIRFSERRSAPLELSDENVPRVWTPDYIVYRRISAPERP